MIFHRAGYIQFAALNAAAQESSNQTLVANQEFLE